MTGVGTVTGANFLLNVPQKDSSKPAKILIDCGMVQGSKEAESQNRIPFAFNVYETHSLVITHAHLDHVGRIPKLVKDGFRGKIYSTPATRDLARLILEDAVHLLRQSAEREGVAPLYEEGDVELAFSFWNIVEYHTAFNLTEGVSAHFLDAGHILGSAIVEFTIHEELLGIGDRKKKIAFTGDLGNTPTPILRDTEYVTDAEYLVMESVYGDRNHESHDARIRELERIIKETHQRKGTLVIPAFSVERTQVILYEINNLIEEGKIPAMPVFLDSPLASRVTEVYRSYTELFNPSTKKRIEQRGDIFDFPKLTITASNRDSKEISKTDAPKIIVAGSGMSMGGRVRRHEAEYAPDPHSTILLVGYQPAGTLGRQLQEKAKSINVDGEKVQVKARIETIFGYSAHKDSDHLVEFVSHGQERLKKAFVVMGELKSSTKLAQRLRNELGVEAVCPEPEKIYLL